MQMQSCGRIAVWGFKGPDAISQEPWVWNGVGHVSNMCRGVRGVHPAEILTHMVSKWHKKGEPAEPQV